MSALIVTLLVGPAWAQQVQVEEFTLDNGMKFLLVPRTEQPNHIAAGWVAKVGSVNERPGITGISHFFEHMMFKGTTTIGTRDPSKDAEFMDKQRAIHEKILGLIWTEQYKRYKAGEIDDPWNPVNDTPELAKLRSELKNLVSIQQGTKNAERIAKLESEISNLKQATPPDAARIETLEGEKKRLDAEQKAAATIVKNEFDSVYTRLGASGMNAFTTNDLTFYFINVPSNKFELWAWMESDRLRDSVFREFYSERDVVHEERRLRTESTPTGIFEEQFDAMFWESSPYHWPVIGWTSDLNSYTREEADRYFNIYYRPNNLIGVVVGDFKPAQIKPVIQQYFGRLTPGQQPPPPVVTLEMAHNAEQRLYAECDCQPQIEVRYHTVPFNHADSFTLEMMSGVLNDRTGRLYKSMVEGKKIASSASTATTGLGGPSKYAGYFSFFGEVKGEAAPEQLEQAWYEELERLQNEPVGERELQKVKNQAAADAFRRLQSNFFLMLQVGYYEGLGDWRFINESPAKLQAVTAQDIQRVAKTYFDPKNRSVAIYTRKKGTGEESLEELFAKLDEKQQQIASLAIYRLEQFDVENLRKVMADVSADSKQVSPNVAPALRYLIRWAEKRIAELEASPGQKKE